MIERLLLLMPATNNRIRTLVHILVYDYEGIMLDASLVELDYNDQKCQNVSITFPCIKNV